jgi:hypothetical protein
MMNGLAIVLQERDVSGRPLPRPRCGTCHSRVHPGAHRLSLGMIYYFAISRS